MVCQRYDATNVISTFISMDIYAQMELGTIGIIPLLFVYWIPVDCFCISSEGLLIFS